MHSKRQRGLALDKCVRIAKQISTRSFQCSCQGYRMVSWLLWLVPMLNQMLCAGRFYQVLNINLGLCVTYWLLFPCALSWAFFRFPIPFPHLSHYTAFILEYSWSISCVVAHSKLRFLDDICSLLMFWPQLPLFWFIH